MFARLDPVIRAVVVAIVGGRSLGPVGRDDLRIEVWLRLLENQRAKLRAWDPTRASLDKYIQLVARSQVLSHLRKDQRRSKTAPMLPLESDPRTASANPETKTMTADLARQTDECTRRKLARRHKHLRFYELQIVDGRSDQEVEEALGISRNQLFGLRSEVRKIWQECYRTISRRD